MNTALRIGFTYDPARVSDRTSLQLLQGCLATRPFPAKLEIVESPGIGCPNLIVAIGGVVREFPGPFTELVISGFLDGMNRFYEEIAQTAYRAKLAQ